MLSENSFLRKLPLAPDLKTRLQLEAIGIALDTLGTAYANMRQISTEISTQSLMEIKTEQKVALFYHGWCIVDQIHMLRLLLGTLNPQPDGVLNQFIQANEAVTLARNYMDHIDKFIPNLSKAKKRRPPVFGVIRFVP